MAADIDIDFGDRTKILDLIEHIPARNTDQSKSKRHNSGVYVTYVPYDPLNKCAAIDYVEAERRGYFKLDMLNVSIYSQIKDQNHYDRLLNQEPPWSKLWLDSNWAQQIIHVGNYTALLATMQPDSLIRMAAFISIIRPGKAHLQGSNWADVLEQVWDGDSSRGFVFKKSHAVGYAHLVKLHMNLLHVIQ